MAYTCIMRIEKQLEALLPVQERLCTIPLQPLIKASLRYFTYQLTVFSFLASLSCTQWPAFKVNGKAVLRELLQLCCPLAVEWLSDLLCWPCTGILPSGGRAPLVWPADHLHHKQPGDYQHCG